jgi:signal transduction histidine kinase
MHRCTIAFDAVVIRVDIDDAGDAHLPTEQLLASQAEELRRKNQELHEARDRAESATRAKSDFLANMSHEIRTPMTAILGFADVLLHEDGLDRAPPDRRRAIETIQRNGEHLLGVINDILDVSKIESGKMSVETIACSPFQIVEDVLALMRLRAEAKGLQLVKEYCFPIPAQIRSDPTRIRQILMNLVGNAVKFTEKGSIKIRTSYLADPEARLAFDVVDTGVGMDPDQSSKLFQPFSQADSSTTRRFGGTGLGLTICKRLAEMLGGGISFTSALGVGTTFSFWVDAGCLEGVSLRDCERSEPPRDAPIPHPARRESDRKAPEPIKGLHILLAEDGPDNQRLIAFLLRKGGAEVTIVENGRQAVDVATAAPAEQPLFDLILMDMQMPEMDGYEAARLLRRLGYSEPIVALTANAMAGDRERCLAAGCDDFATKPIDKARLFETILRAAHRATSPTAAQ